jgi:hypothetical protein
MQTATHLICGIVLNVFARSLAEPSSRNGGFEQLGLGQGL